MSHDRARMTAWGLRSAESFNWAAVQAQPVCHRPPIAGSPLVAGSRRSSPGTLRGALATLHRLQGLDLAAVYDWLVLETKCSADLTEA